LQCALQALRDGIARPRELPSARRLDHPARYLPGASRAVLGRRLR
jgi:hypothetical protein